MSGPIRLVISDVDGTLLATDKTLPERNREAVSKIHAAGIGFSIISSRPPFGLKALAQQLELKLPFGAFNGAALVMPDLSPISQHYLSRDAVLGALDLFRSFSVRAWIFTPRHWIVDDPSAPYVDLETRTVGSRPEVVARLEDHVDQVSKVIGASEDFDKLNGCELAAQRTLIGKATVARSQRYYLDVTPAGVDKGTCVDALRRRLGLAKEEIATLGDMENDVPMFRQSGLSISMGNATAAVEACAVASTLSNDDDGFAEAVEKLILPRAPS
jgi:Cof subfamily protein (haloacid dehalogenase superfamily)